MFLKENSKVASSAISDTREVACCVIWMEMDNGREVVWVEKLAALEELAFERRQVSVPRKPDLINQIN